MHRAVPVCSGRRGVKQGVPRLNSVSVSSMLKAHPRTKSRGCGGNRSWVVLAACLCSSCHSCKVGSSMTPTIRPKISFSGSKSEPPRPSHSSQASRTNSELNLAFVASSSGGFGRRGTSGHHRPPEYSAVGPTLYSSTAGAVINFSGPDFGCSLAFGSALSL